MRADDAGGGGGGGGAAPASEEEFERALAAAPGSSFTWIKYMAHALSLTDVAKARAIGERALAAIPYREEGEKMNVWVALLNLESTYAAKEDVLKLFQRALQFCDPKKLHFALLGIWERAEQHEMADQLFRAMAKKFGASAKVWLRMIANLLKRGEAARAAQALDRSLLSLPKRKHIKVISRAALLEFRHGSAERGKAMFEGVLRNYPKRIDLWTAYIDQVIKSGDVDAVRSLFERVICLDLPPKKMKLLFKKYLDYEVAHGDASTVEGVKAKAMAYVENKLT